MAEHLRIDKLYDVRDRCIAITGGGSGIGLMLARGFVVNGASVILVDFNQSALADAQTQLEAIQKGDAANKATITTIHADLSTEEAVAAVAIKIKALPGLTSLDGLYHCAAVRYMNGITYTPGESLELLEAATLSAPYKEWEHAFRTNVLAPYYLTADLVTLLGAAAARGDGRGCVVLFSSPASVHNHQFVPVYQTTKAAVDHLVRIMAMEFAQYYIRVNAMSPGIVPSGMTPNDGTSNLRLAEEAPAGRAGNDEDMVGCAIWLASKAGAFMDGKIVRIEGGRLLILKGVTSNSD